MVGVLCRWVEGQVRQDKEVPELEGSGFPREEVSSRIRHSRHSGLVPCRAGRHMPGEVQACNEQVAVGRGRQRVSGKSA